MVRWTGAVVVGIALVDGTVWMVRMPRPRKRPPRRACAVDTMSVEKARNRLIRRAESRNCRDVSIVVPMSNEHAIYGDARGRFKTSSADAVRFWGNGRHAEQPRLDLCLACE